MKQHVQELKGRVRTARTASGKTLDLVCAQKAVAAREDALIAAQKASTDKLMAAYQARKTALAAAYAKTDAKERQNAVRMAWKTFGESARGARKTWLTARNDAWKTFRTSAKTCGSMPTETGAEEMTGM